MLNQADNQKYEEQEQNETKKKQTNKQIGNDFYLFILLDFHNIY